MEQYISKSAVVTEIDKLKGKVFDSSSYCDGWQHALRMLELSLDTLEVKENGLVEEIDYEDYARFFNEHPYYNDISWGFEEAWTFAQYFYKLGLKSQKGE